MKILGILHSENSVSAARENAKRSGAIYAFRGARGKVVWLRGTHARLGASGASNFFRRWCVPHALVGEKQFADSPETFHTLILGDASNLGSDFIDVFQSWLNRGGRAVVAGSTNLPLSTLRVRGMEAFSPPSDSFVIIRNTEKSDDVCACAPGDYISSIIAYHDARSVGNGLISRTPSPAQAVAALPGSMAIFTDNIFFTPIPFFDYFGALLQGHADLPVPTSETSSLQWLDEYAYAAKNLLAAGGFENLWRCAVSPWPKPEKVVVLRHDLDYTRDTAFADREIETSTPASFSLRNDANLGFWKEKLSPHAFLEMNYHFDSVFDQQPIHRRALAKARIVRLPELVQPAFERITGDGIAKSIRASAALLGGAPKTAFKHGSTFCYPETVEALAAAFENLPNLRGASTTFRWNLFRYRAAQDAAQTTTDYPGTPVPFWFPLRMWLATAQKHEPLRGWDITAVNDTPSAVIDELLEARNAPPWGVYSFNFHPGHTRESHYCKGGSLPCFEHLLDKTRKADLNVMTCAEAFEALNRWETLRLETSGEKTRIVNTGAFHFESLWVRIDGVLKRTGPLNPGGAVEL